jgi:methionine-rich copper-binding protein CopC
MPKSLLLVCLVSLIGFSQAHSYLTAAVPPPGAVLETQPQVISLTMSEGIELKFSLFKVYRLDTIPQDNKALVKAAKDLLTEKIKLKDDEAVRADVGVIAPQNRSKEIRLGLKDGLEPGLYIIMWKVLSIDSHSSEDFSYFIYQPAQP